MPKLCHIILIMKRGRNKSDPLCFDSGLTLDIDDKHTIKGDNAIRVKQTQVNCATQTYGAVGMLEFAVTVDYAVSIRWRYRPGNMSGIR